MREIPKPNLQRFVDAIKELTDQACDRLQGVPRDDLQLVVVQALERGIELQRDVILVQEAETPLRPPPLEDEEEPTKPGFKLPKGI